MTDLRKSAVDTLDESIETMLSPSPTSLRIPYPWNENGLTDAEKVHRIESNFREILATLGLDLNDDSIRNTPNRYAKMLVHEVFEGLSEAAYPKITTQSNTFGYRSPLIETGISIESICEHHFVPILGYCHIAYVPEDRVIGLSKLNRVAKYFARRPQVQERLTRQIAQELAEILGTESVAVAVDAVHLCVRMRGIRDHNALTRTIDLGGQFLSGPIRDEFFGAIPDTSSQLS
ncbi:GTP cyclohydrolase I FolE [Agreia sp. PsM10]|uniref:GTP cyclohydrolase I FolE n=1 Tax=Agreia sp. PsM10 TaxID=3030533 RepID=UPI00263B7686|nr:GTP cyclohydrolase I FolE [Agreia sp. PsM10]MDN4641654.1 GTP cyclohydrolase I FolE [Agreia sp. PsM10]